MNTTGFPSPAQGYEEKPLDFNSLLIKNPAATFAMRFSGNIEKSYNIASGDILIVDCSIKPKKGMLAVIRNDGEFQCKQIDSVSNSSADQCYSFTAANGKEQTCFEIFGIVRAVVRIL